MKYYSTNQDNIIVDAITFPLKDISNTKPLSATRRNNGGWWNLKMDSIECPELKPKPNEQRIADAPLCFIYGSVCIVDLEENIFVRWPGGCRTK